MLREISTVFQSDHFRANESGAGKHRIIEQPTLGTGCVLIWDAEGNGSTGSHMRVYLADDGVTIAFNAAWSISAWLRNKPNVASGGLRIGSTGIEVLYDGTLGSSFSAWGTTLRLALDSTNMQTAFQATGHATETERCGARIRNGESAVRSLGADHAVNFRSRMPSVPSSVTLSPLSNTTPVPTVTADQGNVGQKNASRTRCRISPMRQTAREMQQRKTRTANCAPAPSHTGPTPGRILCVEARHAASTG